jgi:antitoxin (DNA-binding transcriptional repressor) of toxin-antitoxin stability system
MNTPITAIELSKNLSDIVNRVHYRGERFTLVCNGEPIAVLGPADVPSRVTLRELAAQLGDIPLPDAGFADDVEAVRRAVKNPRYALCRGRDGR